MSLFTSKNGNSHDSVADGPQRSVKTVRQNRMNKRIKTRSRLYFVAMVAGAAFLTNCATYTDPQLSAIQARANAAISKLVSKDPKLVKRVNAELAQVRADLGAYANLNGLPVEKLKLNLSPKAVSKLCEPYFSIVDSSGRVQGNCTLTGVHFTEESGLPVCDYECIQRPNVPR
jgi:hypothetical protein